MRCNTRLFADCRCEKEVRLAANSPISGCWILDAGYWNGGSLRFMKLTDEFSTYVADLLDGHYDCVDRIVLNGYFLMGQTSGGLLIWWNRLYPGAPLDQKRLEQMAGDFSRRVYAFGKKNDVPVIPCALGDKTKHQKAEKLLP